MTISLDQAKAMVDDKQISVSHIAVNSSGQRHFNDVDAFIEWAYENKFSAAAVFSEMEINGQVYRAKVDVPSSIFHSNSNASPYNSIIEGLRLELVRQIAETKNN